LEARSLDLLLAAGLRQKIHRADVEMEQLQEIRLRIGKPFLMRYQEQEYALTDKGELSKHAELGHIVTEEELRQTLETISGYSLYAFDEELRQGFMTVPGGHRIGVTGKIVMEEGQIRCVHPVSGINIRLAHQVCGCGDAVLPHLIRDGALCHTLILSPPRCGKSTLLRDLIRQVSDGSRWMEGKTVGVVDERSEIAGCYRGVAQNDVGIRTDVLDGCAKAEGMMMLLRSMSPQVIAVDEIGSAADRDALENVFYCGCTLLATAHGSSVEDIKRSPMLQQMVQQQMFERYVILKTPPVGSVKEILDGSGRRVWSGDGQP
jgi:stage III sporulation protein AA